MLFDLPAVAERARARFSQAGLAGRAQAVGGDFLRDPLPGGADVVSLVRVLHDHDDAPGARHPARCHRALPAGGTLLLAEPMSGTPGAEPIGRRVFRLLPAGDGPRPAADRRARSGTCCAAPASPQMPVDPDAHPAA